MLWLAAAFTLTGAASSSVALWTDTFSETATALIAADTEISERDIQCPLTERPYVYGMPKRFDSCPLGTLRLTELIYEGAHGNLFLANPYAAQTVVVKYLNDCYERLSGGKVEEDLLHPLQNEYLIMSVLNETDISPKVFYLSPPSALPTIPGSSRFVGLSGQSRYSECVAAGSEVRFLVEETVGMSLIDYANQIAMESPEVFRSAAFSKQMIRIVRRIAQQLKTLHTLGFIHDDIHNGNIVFRVPFQQIPIDSDDVMLIDFGLSSFYPVRLGDPIQAADVVHSRRTKSMSLWQLKGERSGPRDDMYRLVLMLAELLSRDQYVIGSETLLVRNLKLFGNPLFRSPEYRSIDVRVALYIREHLLMFQHDISLGSMAVIGSNDAEIIPLLTEVETHVKSYYPHPDSLLDYEYIDSKFSEIIDLLP